MEIKAKEITLFPSVKLSEYPKNVNVHTEEQIDKIIQLIDFYGHRDPLIVDADIQPNGTHWVLAGNGRLQASKKAGWDNLPIIFQKFNSEEEKYGFMVSHNAVSSSGWGGGLDLAKINTDIIDLGPDFDIEMLAIKDFVIEPIEKFEPLSDEDEVPEVVHPITRRGDLWILGNHRLYCGDSTMIDDVDKLMNGEKADMVYTDPPYGINEKGDRSKRNAKNSLKEGVTYTDFKDDSIQYAIDAFNLCEALDIPVQIWWGANYYCHSLPQTNNWLVWDKRLEDKQRDFNSDAELAFVKNNKNSVRIFRHLWKGLIKGSEHGVARVHPTQKPIALAEWCFSEYGEDAKTVIDLFLGSGSTMIACEKLQLRCMGMELSEQYCDVIINRWQNYTGKKATLESSGQTYEELKQERGE